MSTGGLLRHRPVPERSLGDEVIVARPGDGVPLVLECTAAAVWRQLDGWVGTDDIDRGLAARFPEVSRDERVAVRREILIMLVDEGLVERD
jgi:hypothetical protein